MLWQLDHVCLLKGDSTRFLVAKLCSMVLVAFDKFSEVKAVNWICWLCVFQSPVLPSSSNSLLRCDLTVAQLLGAALSSAGLEADPAWLGNLCCTRNTSMSSGMTVCMDLSGMLSCCSQLVSSVATA